MFASFIALALLAPQQPSNQVKFVPSANVQILFSRDLEPVPPQASSRLESKGRLGWETEAVWFAKAPRAEVRLTHWTYPKGKKPLLTPKEIATELYSNSELVDTKEELERAYADRKVIEAKLGPYPATIDLHHDKELSQHRGTLAFGDDSQQWLVEVIGDAKLEGIDKAVRSIIASVRPMNPTKEELAKGLNKMWNLPGTGFEIAAPATLTARVASPESRRPLLWAHWYALDLTDDFMISVQDNAYGDKKQPNLKADLDYVANALRDGSRKFGKPEDREGNQEGWTTFMRVQPITEGDRTYTMVWSYWSSPGRTIFAVVKVADRIGGALRAREIARSLRPARAKT